MASDNLNTVLDELFVPPSYTVEGRLGQRWWTWQRFAEHDDAARSIANLIEAKRFDAIRLLETQHRAGHPPIVLRELFLYDPAANAALASPEPVAPAPPVVAPPPAALPLEPATPPSKAATTAPPAAKQAMAANKMPSPAVPSTTPLIGAPAAEAVSAAFARMAAEVSAQRRRAEEKRLEQHRVEVAAASNAAEAWPALWRATVPLAAPVRLAAPAKAAPKTRDSRDPFDDTGADDYAPLVAVEETAIPAVAAAAPAPAVAASQPTWDPAEIDAAMAALKAALREVEAVVPSRPAPLAPPNALPLADFTASDRPTAEPAHVEPANDAIVTQPAANDHRSATADDAEDPYWDDAAAPVRVARTGSWRFRLRRVGYSLGAAAASILLAIAGYETTRLAIGLPDLLGGVGTTVGALFAGPERPIVAAARRGDGAEVERLLQGGFSAESADPQGVPALLVAARNGHADIVRLLLDAGADPNRRFGQADTPILAATREGLLPSVDAMLSRGGQVNGRGGADDCDTPLLLAAAAGRLEMVTFLLSRGATFDVLPGCRRGPLDAAAPHPRVRDALENAYQRRLAGVPRAAPGIAPGIAPAVATGSDVAAPPRATAMTPPPALPAALPTPAPPPVPTMKPAVAEPKAAEPKAGPTGYGALMYGLAWHDSLGEVKAKARECRALGRRYEVCTLAVKPIFDDTATVEAWFDRADNDRFVSIETRSIDLVDYTAQRDGAAVRRRFDEVRRELERFLPPGARPILQKNLPPGSMTFFEGLKPDVAAADFSAFWSDDNRRRPASVHLKLTGIDNRKGFYRIVVGNPLRQTQQAQARP